MNSPVEATPIFNETRFERMACGDIEGFHELADEFFEDVRSRLLKWPALYDSGEFRRLSEEFHRCKGGAAMFGFERLFSLLGNWETDSKIEQGEVDLKRFVSELEAAEFAVAAIRSEPSNG
jgi:HPt (histidine-containing phosphotransfer) domain-containing protein